MRRRRYVRPWFPSSLAARCLTLILLSATALPAGAHDDEDHAPSEAIKTEDQPADSLSIKHQIGARVATYTVREGQHVRMTVDAPEPVEIHLHGYDLVAMAKPGAPAILSFRANVSGRFALVLHTDQDLLGREEKAIAYLEVQPQ